MEHQSAMYFRLTQLCAHIGAVRLRHLALQMLLVVGLLGGSLHLTEHSFAQALSQDSDKQQSSDHERIRLVVANFDMVSRSQKFQFLERGLAEFIQLSLLSHRPIEVIHHGILWEALQQLPVSRKDYTKNRIFSRDVLDSVGIDVVARGKYKTFGNTILVSTMLEDVETSRQVRLRTVTMEAEQILIGLPEFARVIVEGVDELRKAHGESLIHPVAVVCFRNLEQTPTKESDLIAQDFDRWSAIVLENHPRINLVQEAENSRDCFGDVARESAEITWPDAYLTGTVKQTPGGWKIYPVLVISKENAHTTVDFPEFSGDEIDYEAYKVRFAEIFARIVDEILTDRGEWNLKAWADANNSPEDFARSATVALAENDHGTAQAFVAKAFALDPESAEAKVALARLEMANDDYDSAINILRSLIDTDPYLTDAYEPLADSYLATNAFTQAKDLYLRAIEQNIDVRQPYARLASISQLEGDLSAAIEFLEKSHELNPDDPEIIEQLATIEFREKRWERSISWLGKLLEEQPHSERYLREITEAYWEWGWEQAESGDVRRAMEILDRALADYPRTDLYTDRASFVFMLAEPSATDLNEAADHLNKALELAVDEENIRNSFEWASISLAEVHIALGELQPARDAVGKVTNENFSDVVLVFQEIIAVLDGREEKTAIDFIKNEVKTWPFEDDYYIWNSGFIKDYLENASWVDEKARTSALGLLAFLEEFDGQL